MLTAFPISNGYAPNEGPKCLPQTIDFSTVSPQSFDLEREMTLAVISFIQGVFVDNSANPAALTIVISGTQQRIVVPANSQGTWPVLGIVPMMYTVSTTPGAGIKPAITWLNVPTAYSVWGPVTLNVANLNPTQISFTARSGSIAVGGTSQQLAAANALRKAIIIENPATASGQGIGTSESLFINFVGAAGVNDGSSFEVTPGGYFPPAGLFNTVSTDQINVNAATTGHRWIAKEG